MNGWAIPTATDIAFAIAVLGLIAPRIPASLRMFLLTLAVVDDLVAIAIIAVAYTSALNWLPLVAALLPTAVYAWVVRRFSAWFAHSKTGPWFILLPLGVLVWALVHASGVHATVAAVILAFTVPVAGKTGERTAEVFEDRFRPLSSGVAIPLFAFFAAGVSISGNHDFPSHPIAVGILAGLVLGKPIGITLVTWLVTRFPWARLPDNVRWREFVGIASLAGVGFTVSLLIVELSLPGEVEGNTAKLAVISASLISIGAASALLIRRRRRSAPNILARIP